MFTINEQVYGNPEDDETGDIGTEDEWEYRLNQVVLRVGQRFTYEYDFGDSWEHTLVLEAVLDPDPDVKTLQCIKGKRTCPPEDVGGVYGYAAFLKAIQNPSHEEHEEYLTWVGGSYDPDAFDVDEVNSRLRKLKRQLEESSDFWEDQDESASTSALPDNLTWLDNQVLDYS
jgi:hypothetical protein